MISLGWNSNVINKSRTSLESVDASQMTTIMWLVAVVVSVNLDEFNFSSVCYLLLRYALHFYAVFRKSLYANVIYSFYCCYRRHRVVAGSCCRRCPRTTMQIDKI